MGEVTRFGGVTRVHIMSYFNFITHDRWGDHIRDYMDRQVTPPKRGPPPPGP